MPQYEYCHERKVWIKQCSFCKEITLGTTDQDESIRIFVVAFGLDRSTRISDGMRHRCRDCNHISRVQLGITKYDVKSMWQDQNGKCAICEKDISIVRNVGSELVANVDHDKETGEVRELLCSMCNQGIGQLNHDITILEKAIAYLKKHAKISAIRKCA